MKPSNRRHGLVYGVPFAIAGASLTTGAIAYNSTPVLRWLMYATAAAAIFMFWAPGRYATIALLTAAWLGRAVSALYGIDGYDDRTNIVVAALWPCLWYLALIAIFAFHIVRVEDRALGD